MGVLTRKVSSELGRWEFLRFRRRDGEDTSQVRLLHELAKIHARFDDPHLVSQAGLIPVMALAQRAGLGELAGEHVRISRPCGVNAEVKVPCMVAGMSARADSIEDMSVLRHGALPDLFGGIRAPPRWGRSCGRSPGATCCSWAKCTARCWPGWRRCPAAAWRGCARVRRPGLPAETGLRARQAGRGVRVHQDPGQGPAGPRPERAGRQAARAVAGLAMTDIEREPSEEVRTTSPRWWRRRRWTGRRNWSDEAELKGPWRIPGQRTAQVGVSERHTLMLSRYLPSTMRSALIADWAGLKNRIPSLNISVAALPLRAFRRCAESIPASAGTPLADTFASPNPSGQPQVRVSKVGIQSSISACTGPLGNG